MKNIKTLGLAMLTALLVSCNTDNVASTSKNSSSNPITNSSSTTVVKKQSTINNPRNNADHPCENPVKSFVYTAVGCPWNRLCA